MRNRSVNNVRSYRYRRLEYLGEILRLPAHPRDALPAMRHAPGWSRLGLDPWQFSIVLVLAACIAVAYLLLVLIFHLLRLTPPEAQLIGDLRFTVHYASNPLTSGAVVGKEWVVLGTEGSGVQAYHINSGAPGIWRTFNVSNTGGALQNETVMDAGSSLHGAWFLTGGHGLTWASPELDEWMSLVGVNGFPAAPAQEDIIDTALSPGSTHLAVATENIVGVYDTRQHNWIGQVEIEGKILDIAMSTNRLFVGSEQGLFAFQIPNSNENSLEPDPDLSIRDAKIVKFNRGNTILLAVTAGYGLLCLPLQTEVSGEKWNWLVGEDGLAISQINFTQITDVTLDDQAIWVAYGSRVGQYQFVDHNWNIYSPDGQDVSSLTIFGGTAWVGTSKGLYRFDSGEWRKVEGGESEGIRKIIGAEQHLWALFTNGRVAYMNKDGEWKTAIGAGAFQEGGTEPLVTDVDIYHGEYWVSSKNAGISSYDPEAHTWQERHTVEGSSLSAVDIHAGLDGMWALASTGTSNTPPYPLWRWEISEWKPVTDVVGIEFTNFAGSTWLLGGDGALIRLSENTVDRYYETVTFDPEKFNTFFPIDTKSVLVGGADGLLKYDREKHSWELVDEIPVLDLAWGNSQLMRVSINGGLTYGKSTIIPIEPEVPSLKTPTTAAPWNGRIWFSDGQQIASYEPTTHAIKKQPAIENAVILQLRAGQAGLFALANMNGSLGIYRLADNEQGWTSITPKASSLAGYSLWGDSLAYVLADNSLHLWINGKEQVYFDGTANGLGDVVTVIQTSENDFWILSRSSGLYCYSPRFGSWYKSPIANPKQILQTQDKSGEEVILVASQDGLYKQIPTPGRQPEKISGDTIVDIAKVGNLVYVLTARPTSLLKWDGEIIEQSQLPSNIVPVELASSTGQLWLRVADKLYTFDGDRVSPSAVILPSSDAQSHLVERDARDTLYFGSGKECWQLFGSQFSPCSNPAFLIQTTRTLQDPYGRFKWELSALNAKLLESSGSADVGIEWFDSDRARAIQVNANSDLLIQTDGGVWVVPLNSEAARLSSRQLTAQPFSEAPVATLDISLPGDQWQWKIRLSNHLGADQIDITYKDRAEIRRRISGGRFADETATAIEFFDNKFWLGTKAGLWILDTPGVALENRLFVEGFEDSGIKKLFATDDSMYAVHDQGSIWQYQDNRWSQVSTLPSEVFRQVEGDLGPLFWQTSDGMETATFTNFPQPRFVQDQVFSFMGIGDYLWIGTPLGLIKAELKNNGFSYVSLDLEQMPTADSIQLLSDGQALFAQVLKNRVTEFYEYNVSEWVSTDIDKTPFWENAAIPANIPGAPLRWLKAEGGTKLSPWLDYVHLSWVNGLLGSDAINDIFLDQDGNVLMATHAGPIVYDPEAGFVQPIALPTEDLARPILSIGQASQGIWLQHDNSTYSTAQIDGGRLELLQANPKPSQLLRLSVGMVDGRWLLAPTALNTPMLWVQGLTQNNLFTNNGRFTFDQILDAASNGSTVLIGTTAGALSYSSIPLTQVEAWTFVGQEVEQVTIEGAAQWAKVGLNAYKRGTNSDDWQPTTENSVFLPMGISLVEGKWSSEHRDIMHGGSLLEIEGLSNLSTVFGADDKFLFDNVLAIASKNESVWLLTEAGWVNLQFDPHNRLIMSYRVFGQPVFRESVPVKNAFLGKVGLVVDLEFPEGVKRLTWKLDDGAPVLASEQIIDSETRFSGESYEARNFNEDYIGIVWKDSIILIDDAANWFWPFRLVPGPFMFDISRIVDFAEDNDSLWAITQSGLIKVNKHQWGIP